MGIHEQLPSKNNDQEILKPLGLSIEDFPDELAAKDELSETLIRGINSHTEEDIEKKENRVNQLGILKKELQVMRAQALREGGALNEIEKIDQILEKIDTARAN